jgi:hypothetical protein
LSPCLCVSLSLPPLSVPFSSPSLSPCVCLYICIPLSLRPRLAGPSYPSHHGLRYCTVLHTEIALTMAWYSLICNMSSYQHWPHYFTIEKYSLNACIFPTNKLSLVRSLSIYWPINLSPCLCVSLSLHPLSVPLSSPSLSPCVCLYICIPLSLAPRLAGPLYASHHGLWHFTVLRTENRSRGFAFTWERERERKRERDRDR